MLVAEVLERSGAPALGGAVFGPDGPVFLEVAGVRRAGGAEPVAPGDRWHLGSNAKAMTAVLYARLVEQGRARWGATLAELFAGWALDPGLARGTVEDLLSHRLGLDDRGVLDGPALRAAHADPRPPAEQRREMAAAALEAPFQGRPGRFRYANINFVVAGAAIERIAGRPWEDAVTAELFGPLGMASAGFGAPGGEAPWGHAAPGRTPVDPADLADNPRVMGPAGTVHASLADYGRFLRLFLARDGGGGFLRPDTLARIEEAPPHATRAYPRWLARLSGGERYWLGWLHYPRRAWARGPVLAHEGSNTLWHAFAAVAPERGVAVAAVSNDGAAAGRRATRALAARLVRRFAPA